MPQQQNNSSERSPLLQTGSANGHSQRQEEETVSFDPNGDPGNPREWTLKRKYFQTFQIFMLASICPMASSIFAPAIQVIADEFGVSRQLVIGGQTGFVCMLGAGPLFLAPMSETFGRRILFVSNLAVFTLLQIPTALSPNVENFLVWRTLGGFFGSVGVANGGGSIFDMFETHERAPVLGVYLIAPLIAPTVGSMIGAFIVSSYDWRIIFWVQFVATAAVTIFCYFFLSETNAVAVLSIRKKELQKKHPNVHYTVDGASDMPIPKKILGNCTRAVRILTTQPIVTTMSSYQALIFSSMYSLFASYNAIWSSPPYYFNKMQVGLCFLAPAVGFVSLSVFVVMYIDPIYNYLARKYKDDGQPEYRLAFANIGAVLLPISLFWFGWSVEQGLSWPIPVLASALFGASQVAIFNPVQTYYIDSFAENAASALAAGAFLRSVVGGIVPLFVGKMFDELGYGWGMSVFGILSVMLMPAPILFMKYGRMLREQFPFKG